MLRESLLCDKYLPNFAKFWKLLDSGVATPKGKKGKKGGGSAKSDKGGKKGKKKKKKGHETPPTPEPVIVEPKIILVPVSIQNILNTTRNS